MSVIQAKDSDTSHPKGYGGNGEVETQVSQDKGLLMNWVWALRGRKALGMTPELMNI